MEIEFEDVDFALLYATSMAWKGLSDDWRDHADRFSAPDPAVDGAINWAHARAYWFADAASMILARSWLRQYGQECQVLLDEVDRGAHPLPFVITTDYEV